MSVHVAIRCADCTRLFVGGESDGLYRVRVQAKLNGWEIYGFERCPSCVSKRNAKQQAEAAMEYKKCVYCEGSGKVADTESREPWPEWERLPPGSDIAVKLGIVKPVICNMCGGNGTIASGCAG